MPLPLLLLMPIMLLCSPLSHEEIASVSPTNFEIILFCLLPFWASRTLDSTESDIGIKEIKRKNIAFGTSIFYTVKETKCIINMTDMIFHIFNFRMPLFVFLLFAAFLALSRAKCYNLSIAEMPQTYLWTFLVYKSVYKTVLLHVFPTSFPRTSERQ